jgi:hypothetical protein
MTEFGISDVEALGFATRELIGKVDLSEIGSEDGMWMELAKNHVQWLAFVLIVLNLRVLLPKS